MGESRMDSPAQESHSLLRSLVLSLAPGLLITMVIVVSSVLAVRNGFPYQPVIFLPTLLVILPWELGYLLYQGKRQKKKYTLDGIVLFRNSLPVNQYLLWVPLLTAWNFLIFALMVPVEKFLITHLFYWMPVWLLPAANPASDLALLVDLYTKPLVILVMSGGLILNGVITPVVEELYFRGYLLPRLSHLGHWAPLLNVLLFSIYHFFSPWKYVTIVLALLPAVYLVWKKKAISLTVITHVILNTLGIASGIAYLISQSP